MFPVEPELSPPVARPEPAVPPVMRARPGSSVVEGEGGIPSLTEAAPPAPRKSAMVPLVLGFAFLALVGAGIAAWQLMKTDDGATAGSGSPGSNVAVTPAPADAATVATAKPDAAQISVATAKVDAGTAAKTVDAQVAAPPADAAVVAVAKPDAGAATTPTNPANSGGTTDKLTITSTPAGARVYIDGSDAGVTPLNREGSPDRHTIALLLAGHDLYIAQVDGHGTFAIPLKEVTPPAGPAGIKVLKCKDKDRYYVFLDGKPTGMMCPTERIETELGTHTVEVYDAVSEAKKKYDVVVKDTRLSHRIKIE
jgi:hypothetical protein